MVVEAGHRFGERAPATRLGTRKVWCIETRREAMKVADHRHRRLLRDSMQRPSDRRATCQGDKFAPLHPQTPEDEPSCPGYHKARGGAAISRPYLKSLLAPLRTRYTRGR
jgi:hypothetical protein